MQETLAEALAAERQQKLAQVSVSLEEDGSLTMRDIDGALLSSEDIALVWEQHGEHLRGQLEQRAAKASAENRAVTDIHLDTHDPAEVISYPIVPFSEPQPCTEVILPFEEPEPIMSEVPRLGWISRHIGFFRRRHAARVDAARAHHAAALADWQVRRDHHAKKSEERMRESQAQLAAWDYQRRAHDTAQQQARAEYEHKIQTDPAFMLQMLEAALSHLQWPRETNITAEFAQHGRAALLDVDLPEIEDLPTTIAMLDKAGRRLIWKNKGERALRGEYARHVHGILLFRLAGTAFSVLPALECAIISGFSQRLNKATGYVEDQYLLSVEAHRARFSQINFADLASVDPVEALGIFPIRRCMSTTGVFKPVEPLATADMSRQPQ